MDTSCPVRSSARGSWSGRPGWPNKRASSGCGSLTISTRGTTAQGNSPFVWSVIGALSEAVSLPITTAVTCPTIRIHPAIIAQAAATAAVHSKAASSWASAAAKRSTSTSWLIRGPRSGCGWRCSRRPWS